MRWAASLALGTALVVALLSAAGCAEQSASGQRGRAEAASFESAPGLVDDDAGRAGYFAPEPDGKLHVWFLDVGHGDAVLIQSPTGLTVLIDGGPKEAGSRLAARLPELLNGPLDMVVVTHVDADHYGALTRLLQTVGVRRFLVPRTEGGPEEWDGLLALARTQEIPVFVPGPSPDRPGEPLTIALGGGAVLKVYWPRAPVEPWLEAPDADATNSLVMRLVHEETSVLLTGDATWQTEQHLVARSQALRSTVLKVAGHGTDTASSAEFLRAVKPQAAIVSLGAGNGRGAPSRAVLTRLRQAGAEVFRTDLDGEVRLDGDGRELVLTRERPAVGESRDARLILVSQPEDSSPQANVLSAPAQPVAVAAAVQAPKPAPVRRRPPRRVKAAASRPAPAPAPAPAPKPVRTVVPAAAASAPSMKTPKGAYVASRNSDVFHVPDCRNALRILDKNLVVYRTRKDAERERRPAGDCNP